ncbi:response regulator transcription factor [Ruegeria profundi]|uniref:response regulator transcription factor n=1 Tax=Ruegeria profundi TaxID=1685378 RepID=UPI001CD49C51|nr:response regulator [Ruegeria profundi]MCA0930067.1 response regulator [Ruegeria profundi]
MPETICDVVIVDDDRSLLRALDKQVRAMGYSTQAFDDPLLALEFLEHADWKCLLADLSMPKMNGLELQSHLETRSEPFSVVFLSGVASVRSVTRAMRHGAVNFLEKPVEHGDLQAALSEAVENVEGARRKKNESASARVRFDQLTDRQKEVFWQLVVGASNKQIARNLDVSERTVKAHRSAIRERLGLETQMDMVGFSQTLDMEREGSVEGAK